MLQKILDSGTLIGEGMEEKVRGLTSEQIEFFLGLGNKPLVFDDKVWEAVVNPEIKIIKDKYKHDKESVQDVVNRYNQRLNVLKEELLGNADLKNLVSISSLENLQSSDSVCVIGMFDGEFLEDQTGRIGVDIDINSSTSSRNIIKDEVIGVVGKIFGGKLIPEKIIYPDVEAKEVKKVDLPAKVLITNGIGDVKNVNYVISNEGKDLPERIANVVMDGYGEFEIHGVRFLVVKEAIKNCVDKLSLEGNKIDDNTAGKEIIKRRDLFFKNHWVNDVPDVFVSVAGKTFVEDYRGVTIIGLGEKSVVLDLQTRETV
jgi:hypothetical protein